MTSFPAAVLWDMDGTIVDTEPYWMRAEQQLVASFGGVWTAEDGLTLVGNGLEHSARVLQGRGVDLEIPEIIARLTAEVTAQAAEKIPWRPGARELLQELRDRGVPQALVTMSMRPLAELISTSFDEPVFSAIVTGGDVENAKPHPEPYLTAADLLGVAPGDALAIEDSGPGLASAVAAGTVVLGIPAHVSLPDSTRYTLWPTLAGVTVDELAALFDAASRTASDERIAR